MPLAYWPKDSGCTNRRLQLNVENVDKVVKASCALHNYLRDNRDINATNAILNPDRQDYLGANGAILNLQDLPGYRSATEAQQIREKFKLYLNSLAGQLNWQEDYLPGNR